MGFRPEEGFNAGRPQHRRGALENAAVTPGLIFNVSALSGQRLLQ